MISFISAFRPLLFALVAIVGIETCVLAFAAETPYPRALQSPLFHWSFAHEVDSERIANAVRFEAFAELPADFVQVGDSSGLLAVRPSVLDDRLGQHYLNTSMTMTSQYRGMEAMARRSLEQHPHAHTLVFFAGLNGLMHEDGEGMGQIIAEAYDSPWARVEGALPSLRWRPRIVRSAYERRLVDDMPPMVQRQYDTLMATHGWAGLTVPESRYVGRCQLDPTKFPGAIERIDRFRRIAAAYHRRFAIVIGPVHCRADATTAEFERVLAAYVQTHNVVAPMHGITFVDADLMFDSVHLTPEGSSLYSEVYAAGWQGVAAHDDFYRARIKPVTTHGVGITLRLVEAVGAPMASSDFRSPYAAFDHDADTFWISGERGGEVSGRSWIGQRLASPITITVVGLAQPGNPVNRQDRVQVQYSIDNGATWLNATSEPSTVTANDVDLALDTPAPASMWRVLALGDNAKAPGDAWAPLEVSFRYNPDQP